MPGHDRRVRRGRVALAAGLALAVTRVQNNDGTLPRAMRDLFEAFPDRFVIGTDTAHPFQYPRYADVVAAFRRLLSQLTPETARKIAWENAERLYGPAR